MKDFFKVKDLKEVLEYVSDFSRVGSEFVGLNEIGGRILAADIVCDTDLPDFRRSTMDGYAVRASSTFGSSEGSPAYLSLKGTVAMGTPAAFSIAVGEAAKISTGGMLPRGADSVVMIEHAEMIDDTFIEVYRSVAPGQNILEKGEDYQKGSTILNRGRKLRAQEVGLLAALGIETVSVYQKPVIAIVSTGDEVVPVDEIPGPGQIRDMNTFTLSNLVQNIGGIPLRFGVVPDSFDDLFRTCSAALEQSDMVLISGGSSVGVRDYTVEVLGGLPDAAILVHGISISPGKPTILAKSHGQAIWGLPGHVVSAMIVFEMVVRPFVEHVGGLLQPYKINLKRSALLSRNLSSAQGRIDYVRVRLSDKNGTLWAEPILGKSGLINTMITADGLIEIGLNSEGLEKGAEVDVILF